MDRLYDSFSALPLANFRFVVQVISILPFIKIGVELQRTKIVNYDLIGNECYKYFLPYSNYK